MSRYSIVEWTHDFVKRHVKSGDFCIDATAGRGNDTVFLAQLVGKDGKVLAFDIQPQAVEDTKCLLKEKGLTADVILDSHSNLKEYAENETVDCIVFNFGYLPGGDHKLATKSDTSITAIEQGLLLLKKNGIMSLCIYSGGDSGFEERDALLSYLKEIDPKKYIVIKNDYYNRPNNPPIPVFIIKL